MIVAKIIVFTILIFFGLIGLVSPVGRLIAAPPPELVITWQANSYAPDFFQGKKLPSRGALLDFSAQLINGTKILDITDKEIRGYINNNLIASGIGLGHFRYTVPQDNNDLLLVRSVIVDQDNEVNQFLEIPVVDPEVVIDQSRLPQLKPYFYFFNITSPDDLNLDWNENDQSITLTVKNGKNPLEIGQFTLLKQ